MNEERKVLSKRTVDLKIISESFFLILYLATKATKENRTMTNECCHRQATECVEYFK
jgi:hypothetical protein